jgi:hypothetical protein
MQKIKRIAFKTINSRVPKAPLFIILFNIKSFKKIILFYGFSTLITLQFLLIRNFACNKNCFSTTNIKLKLCKTDY